MAKLCQWCAQINFAAILTPRQCNLTTGDQGPIYRPEYTGNGGDPSLHFERYGKTVRSGPPESYLPQIRTARYEELSSSDDGSEASEHGVEEEDLAPVETDDREDGPADDGFDSGDDPSERLSAEGEGADEDHEDITSSPSETGAFDELLPEVPPCDVSNYVFEAKTVDEAWEQVKLLQEAEGWASGLRPSRRKNKTQTGTNNTHPDESSIDHSVSEADTSALSENASSANTWSYWSHFTELWRIDLKKQAEGQWNYRHGHLYYLGTIWDVRSRRRSCDLCRYFWCRMRTNAFVKEAFLTKSRCVLKCIEFKCKSIDEPEEKEITMLNIMAIYGYKLFDPGEKAWQVKMPFVLQGMHRDKELASPSVSSNAPIQFKDELFGEGRLRGEVCNFDLFVEWQRLCETSHIHPEIDATGDIQIRLIDVIDLCIIEWEGPAGDVPLYFALSYVWGVATQEAMLTRENISRLQMPGGLESLTLNYTVRDAITLTQNMDGRYIWIDALCILQDDEKDKEVQIPQMHLIYGLAALTIIAAFGDDADAGLPGVEPGSRRSSHVAFDLEDITLMTLSNIDKCYTHDGVGIVENYLRKSKYITRAWTFQEALLSTRALIFTRRQVYWECPTCTWCEETHWESETLAFVGQRAINDPTPKEIWEDNFDRRAYGGEAEGKWKRNSYPNLVKSYSQRQLSRDEDILNAFTGVLALIEARERTRFLFALREKHFGNDLLWGWDGPSEPRFAGTEVMEIFSRMPSWTWLSWKGTVDIPNEPRGNSYDPTDDIEPSDGVRCYVLEPDGDDGLRLRVVNESGGWRFHEGYAKRGGGIFDPTWFRRQTKPEKERDDQEEEKNRNDLLALDQSSTAAASRQPSQAEENHGSEHPAKPGKPQESPLRDDTAHSAKRDGR
ncbi:hypothetical protein H2201_003304 [Coniosporium apollinis]|uniref:Heterokaryon incompatibility domain-containing protein n=1 Tax=Coniosporium apollinis TaxID=61459 RepID=A0ABQ9NW69_9PEZI|nr:hypothetical protein H2201_003304 [Coniosporium apollinis]